jgi:glycosyltransferase involved in cell wall biosynthesis
MRILIIAYEFPPSPSPQSLRWAYLAREMAARGHEVHVLVPDLPGDGAGLPQPGPGVQVHRTTAGPIIGFVARRARHTAGRQPPALVPGQIDEAGLQQRVLEKPPSDLNWKGRLFHQVKALAGALRYPDIRGEWTAVARRALPGLLEQLRPAVVVTSHEPASTLALGFQARQLGIPWVADLGDPVLAPYTPARWRSKACALERRVWVGADAVTVTTDATREVLLRRHGPSRGRCATMPQGYDATLGRRENPFVELFDPKRLELLYTGSFYRFRQPEALIEAVLATPDVRLSIASMQVPASVAVQAGKYPGRVRLLGFVRHTDAVLLQRAADVLVNIANSDPAQVPGKFYEYLGSGRPILHLGRDAHDHAAGLLQRAGAGWVCENAGPAVASTLAALRDAKRSGRLDAELVRDEEALQQYRWDRVSDAYVALLVEVAAGAPSLQHATS